MEAQAIGRPTAAARRRQGPAGWLRITLVVCLAWMTALAMGQSFLAEVLELRLLDARFQCRAALIERGWARPVPVDDRIRLILIDDRSRAEEPDPPSLWLPKFVKMGLALLRGGASAVGADHVFLKPDTLADLDEPARADFVELSAVQETALQQKRGGMVFITYLGQDEMGDERLSLPCSDVRACVGDDSLALANLTRDADGRFRAQQLPPLRAANEESKPRGWDFFAPLLAQRAAGVPLDYGCDEGIKFGTLDVPVLSESDRRMMVNFADREAFAPGREPRVWKWHQVRAMMEHPEQIRHAFEGRIVLIGLGTPADQDIVDTPLGPRQAPHTPGGLHLSFSDFGTRSMLGVEAHAHVLNTLLTGAFLRPLPGWVEQLVVLVVCLLSALVALRVRPLIALPAVLGILVAYAGIATWLFVGRGVCVDATSALLGGALAAALVGLQRFTVVRRLFGRYVSDVIAEELLADSSLETLGATGRRRVTVLFSDINGFSTVCEQRTPDEVVRMLNDYFRAMVAVVERRGGWLKQFVGDEIMAVYGVPRPLPHPERAAVESALEMVAALEAMRGSGREGFHDVKIGVHTGEVIVGNVGTESRAERAVVGDDVNLGSRIMGLAPSLGAVILISEATCAMVGDMPGVAFVDRGEHEVKGRARRIRVYEVRRREQ